MGCTCLRHEKEELELHRLSVEIIPVKDLSQILPDHYSPSSIDIQSTNPTSLSIYTISSNTILSYNTQSKSTQKFDLNLTFPIDCGLIPIHSHSILLFAGGLDPILNKEVSKCFSICLKTNNFSNLSPLNTAKRRTRLLLSQDFVYCIGGVKEIKTKFDRKICIKQCYSQNFERYSIEKDLWEVLGDMIYGVEYPAVAVNGNGIFVVGGGCIEKERFEIKKSVQVYRTDTQMWEVCGFELLLPMFGGVCAEYNNGLIVFGGAEDLEDNDSAVYIIDDKVTKVAESTSSLFFLYYCERSGDELFGFNDEDQAVSLNLTNFFVDVNELNL